MDSNSANIEQQLLEKLKSSTNILVTVSANPSVDQLAACLGLTLWLNKIGKHGTAVFSGEVPSTLEFLQPEATLEKNTDSLRDFIIALDKSKADKLRYKVEDRVVKIFITPYRTSLSADDLEFSQGDFNVDTVVAIGVTAQEDLDAAITAHGRILHDATVATINTKSDGQLGSINWTDTQASSLSELVVDLGNELDRAQLDGQIATALLTGIVAETARFSNEKTTPQTMSISAELMSAGANQQLVASKLDAPAPPTNPSDKPDKKSAAKPAQTDDGTLEIKHRHETDDTSGDKSESADDAPAPAPVPEEPEISPSTPEPTPEPANESVAKSTDEPATNDTQTTNRLVTEAPSLGGTLTANSRPDDDPDPVTDPMSLPTVEPNQPLLDHSNDPADSASGPEPSPPLPSLQPPPADWMPPATAAAPAEPLDQPLSEKSADDSETLTEIEQSVGSPHLQTPAGDVPQLSSARDEVQRALNSVPEANLAPVQALNAQPIELTPAPPTEPAAAAAPSTAFDPANFAAVHDPTAPDPTTPAAPLEPVSEDLTGPVDQSLTLPVPPGMPSGAANPPSAVPTTVTDPTAPPPVPPPMFPPIIKS